MFSYVKILLFIPAAAAVLLLLCLGVAVIRTLRMPRKENAYRPSGDTERCNSYADKLSRMVQTETISDRNDPSVEKFLAFHKVLEELFPRVFAAHTQQTLFHLNLLSTGVRHQSQNSSSHV